MKFLDLIDDLQCLVSTNELEIDLESYVQLHDVLRIDLCESVSGCELSKVTDWLADASGPN